MEEEEAEIIKKHSSNTAKPFWTAGQHIVYTIGVEMTRGCLKITAEIIAWSKKKQKNR